MIGVQHGGGIDAAITVYGGLRGDWLDLSTGINPNAYPVPPLDLATWQALPDLAAASKLLQAARGFWNVPNNFDIVLAPGTSSLIAALPNLPGTGYVEILSPTYSEHALAFGRAGWQVDEVAAFSGQAAISVLVNPNNPDGRILKAHQLPKTGTVIVDESFADATRRVSVVGKRMADNLIVLKSFGKFWGLAGLRLGFAICGPSFGNFLRNSLGPWAVSGPALAIGARALADLEWRDAEIARLGQSSARLNGLLTQAGLEIVGGTPLFSLAKSAKTAQIHQHLARNHILTRDFSHRPDWLRFGPPGRQQDWQRLVQALDSLQ